MSTSLTIKILRQWCEDHDVWIDPRLQIRVDDNGEIGVYSESTILPFTSIVHIHKNSVLSVASCSLSEFITPAISGPEAQRALSLALYAEMLNGRNSRWWGYLQSMPIATVDLPLFWTQGYSKNKLSDDGALGMEWLRGTEVERCLVESGQNLEAINDYYFTFAEPLLLRHFDGHLGGIVPMSKPTLHGFYHAYSLVSSRAFLVDAYHCLSMVPIADAFNHSQDHQVHIETDFSVCSQCGSLQACGHDDDEPAIQPAETPRIPLRNDTTHSSLLKKFDDYYEIVTNTPILPHTEVFNTYGETLTNAQLLSQYGFILDTNDNDCLIWDLNQVCRCCVEQSNNLSCTSSEMMSLWASVVQSISKSGLLERLAESNIVYPLAEPTGSGLCLNGDGKISHQLWVFLALSFYLGNSRERSPDIPVILEALGEMLEFQLIKEQSAETVGVVEEYQPNGDYVPSVIAGVAQSVIGLCTFRKNRLGRRRDMVDRVDLNHILDTLPVDMHRTRDAIIIVMGEQSLLDSCEAAWSEILLSFVS